MDRSQFELVMRKAKTMQSLDSDRSDFWAGFQRGLRRQFHGENFGAAEEHEKWMALVSDETRHNLGLGYRLGFHYGEIPADNPGEIRRMLNLSTDELAEIAGVSPRTVEGWEQGRPIAKPALMLIQKFLAC
jgi:hypothetical protein